MVRKRFDIREQRKYKQGMEQVLKEFGREVLLYERDEENATDCPDCDWDSINEVSMDPNCESCSGLGKIYPEIIRQIDAAVRWWDGSIEWDRTSAGRFEEGDCRLTLLIKDVAKDPNDLSQGTYLDDVYKVIVDTIECEVKTPARPKGFREPFICEVIVTRK